MRIAHVFSTFGRGGPQVRAVQLVAHLGASCEHVVVAMDGVTSARELLPAGARVTFAPAPARGGFFATRRRMARWLRELRPDLVLTYNWGAIESVAAARQLGLPLVHHEDGFGPEESERRLWRRSFVRRLLLRRVPVVVPSAVLREIAAREWRLQDAFVHHLPNGVDLARFRPAERPPSGFVVGTVGGLRAEKDQHNLLRALRVLPEHVRLELVGDGPMREALATEARALGIAGRVTFAGQTDDTAPCYRRFSLFALSSRTEQMPIAMLEAMASGLPVVATDVGDVRAILPPEQQAFVEPAGDSSVLATAMVRLVGDPALARRLGEANRRVCEARYEAGLCLERFAALYRRTAGG